MSRVDRIPNSMKSTYVRAGTSRSCAIKAFCQECCGYDREAVRTCSASECPLFAWRPYQKADEGDDAAPEENADTPKPVSARGEALRRWREGQKAKALAESEGGHGDEHEE